MAKKLAKKKTDEYPVYKKWWFWVIVGFVFIGGVGMSINGKNNTDNPNQASQTKDEDKKEDKTDPVLFESTEMEEFCQEDHMVDIQGYFQSIGRNVKVVSMLNYNKFFDENYSQTPDEEQRPIALLNWNGEDKDTGELVVFSCWATKIDGEKKLLLLDIDNHVVRGALTNVYPE